MPSYPLYKSQLEYSQETRSSNIQQYEESILYSASWAATSNRYGDGHMCGWGESSVPNATVRQEIG